MNKIEPKIKLIGQFIKPNNDQNYLNINLLCNDYNIKFLLDNKLYNNFDDYIITKNDLKNILNTDEDDIFLLYNLVEKKYLIFNPIYYYNDKSYTKQVTNFKLYSNQKKEYSFQLFTIPLNIENKIIKSFYELYDLDDNYIYYNNTCFKAKLNFINKDDSYFYYEIIELIEIIFERFDKTYDYFIDNNILFMLTKSFIKIIKINKIDLDNYDFKQDEKSICDLLEESTTEVKEDIKIEESKMIEDINLNYHFLYESLEDETIENYTNVLQERDYLLKLISKDILDNKDLVVDNFYNYLLYKKLRFIKEDIYNFYLSLMSNQLIILAGQSGIGKSKLPIIFSEYFNIKNNDNLLFVPISPSYTEPQDVLGFYNIQNDLYYPSETRLTEFLVKASQNEDRLHLVIFDEMNLSQIEYWFSSLLSILEQDKEDRYLTLYSSKLKCNNSDLFPNKIKIKDNIRFIGTINIDETTKSISDRLIDRTFIINLSKLPFSEFKYLNIGDNKFNILLPNFDAYNLLNFKDIDFANYFSHQELIFFDELNNLLKATNNKFEISYRTLRNIARYLNYSDNYHNFSKENAFDYIISQTILRKVRGSHEIKDLLNNLINILNKYSKLSNFKVSNNLLKDKLEDINNNGLTE